MAKLSDKQREALERLAATGRECAHGLGLSLATLRSLQDHGLVESIFGLEAFSRPTRGIRWSLTPAGRRRHEAEKRWQTRDNVSMLGI